MAELDARYATALLELAVEAGSVDQTLEQTVFLRDTMQDADFRRVMLDPHILSAEKNALLQGMFKGVLEDHLLGFLHLMVEKNREAVLEPSLITLIDLIHSHQRKTTASVISAVELRPPQVSALKDILSKKLDKQVDVKTEVDPSVIGGFYIQVDGYFIDRTVQKQLHDMKVDMKKECGA